MNQEIWKDITGYEGLYKVSNHGLIKSLARKCSCREGKVRSVKEMIRKTSSDFDGYQLITLHKEGKRKMFKLHRIVAEHFVSGRDDDRGISHVNHKDFDKLNNNSNNLEWVSIFQNNQHYLKSFGRIDAAGIELFRTKYNKGQSLNSIAKEMKVSRGLLQGILYGKLYAHRELGKFNRKATAVI